jgi:hypothetical protein
VRVIYITKWLAVYAVATRGSRVKFLCGSCDHQSATYKAAERHADDEHGGARITVRVEDPERTPRRARRENLAVVDVAEAPSDDRWG